MKLNNGVKIPEIGYGTYKIESPKAEELTRMAIDAGYRLIDTAAFYGNEEGVGRAIRTCGVPRDEIFLTTKVWNTDRGYDNTLRAFDASMDRLGLDTLDLYLIHWPANYLQFGDAVVDINRDTWRALERLYKDGRVRSIGLSNFLSQHIAPILDSCEIPPMVDQIEFHPGWYQGGALRYCKDHNIAVEAWSPMGRSSVFQHPTIVAMAEKYGKTPAQICLQWVAQHGIIPIAKSSSMQRMEENLKFSDFKLEEGDMEALNALNAIGGSCKRADDILF